MPTLTSKFDFVLPRELIAQTPARPRDSARLMIVERKTGAIHHQLVSDLPNWLEQHDLLVFNDSRVIKARLRAKLQKDATDINFIREVEVLLLEPIGASGDGTWRVLIGPGKHADPGMKLQLFDGDRLGPIGKIIARDPDGVWDVEWDGDVDDWSQKHGALPIPPYIDRLDDADDYQTIYAAVDGSVAAPTAGLHFTPTLLEALDRKEIERAMVTLHVGLGTFRPIKVERIEEHHMHEERFSIPAASVAAINEARRNHRRVVAVGTTTVRALESATQDPEVADHIQRTSIFITPGYDFKVVDVLMTNFHLPKSSLLVLVSAFAGVDLIRHAYAVAIKERYRFFSFGDAMLIL